MKNVIAKLSALAIFTGMAFSSQAELITFSVAGTTQADIQNGVQTDAEDSILGDSVFFISSEVPVDGVSETDDFEPIFIQDDYANSNVSASINNAFSLSSFSIGEGNARSEVVQTYTLVNGSSSGEYLFNYFVERGVLSADCSGITGPILAQNVSSESSDGPSFSTQPQSSCGDALNSDYAMASFKASLTMFRGNSSTVFFSSDVSISSDGTSVELVENITELQAGTAISGEQLQTLDPNEGIYVVEQAYKSISLGEILANESITIEYRVSVEAHSIPLDSIFSGISDSPTVAKAQFGDPSGFSGNSNSQPSNSILSRVPSATPVSAPGSLLILGLGAIALGFARKTKVAK